MAIKEENELNTGVKETDARIYEVGYLLAPTLSEEQMPVTYGNLKELVASLGGDVISDEMPKMISLAYAMTKVVSNVRNRFNNAYFGWVKFAMDAQKVLELKKRLDLDPQIIRSLIFKTVKENTIATKRFIHRDTTHRRPMTSGKQDENKPVTPINKEEIDKEIDAMIAV